MVPDAELMPTARALAEEIAINCAPVSVSLTKSMIYNFLCENDLEHVERVNEEYFRWLGQQPEPKEGVMSFLEKRKPDWKLKVPRDLPQGFPYR